MRSLFFILFIAFVSCRQTKDVTCDTGSFTFVGVGFSVADFNNATIKQYQPGTNFGELLQSGKITYSLWVRGSLTSDSGNAAPPASMAVAHEPDEIPTTYDYILSVPEVGINDTISNVLFLGPTHEVLTYSDARPAYCVNQMGLYMFNSKQVIPGTPGHLNGVIFLVK
jgi:hypothetical protein